MQKRAKKSSLSSASSIVIAMHKRGKCPAYNKVCKKCSKKGHFAKCCFKKDTHEIEQNSSEESDVCHDSNSSSSSFFVGSVESNKLMKSQIQRMVLILFVIQIMSTHVMTLKIVNGKYLFNQMAQM